MVIINELNAFSTTAIQYLSRLPTIDALQTCVNSMQIPASVKEGILNSSEELKKGIIILASYGNMTDNLITSFKKVCEVVNNHVICIERNVNFITVGVLSLLATETKILNPTTDNNKKNKIYALRIALKIVGYAALIIAGALSIKTLAETGPAISRIESLILKTAERSDQLLSQINFTRSRP